MKNNKGFTIIELAVSFCLVATISIILLQLVLVLKSVYISGDVKTMLLNKQGIMTKKIYDDLNNKDLTSINSCGLSCLTFSYNDGTTANLLVDPGNKTITYNNYTMQLDSSSYFGKLAVTIDENSTSQASKADSILAIDIPIYSKLIEDENFGIHITKQYNRKVTIVKNQIEAINTKVTINGVDTTLGLVKDDTNTSRLAGVFVKLFHQETGNYFDTNYDHFLKNKNAKILSSLSSLEAFRTKKNLDTIINSQYSIIDNDTSLDAKQKERNKTLIKEAYQNGYFSLLLNYDSTSSYDISNDNYMWWYQTSNFAKKEPITGYTIDFPEATIIKNDSCGFTGLQYSSKTDSWVNGCNGNFYNLGSKTTTINGPTAPVNSVDLWVEARDYICNYSLSTVTLNGNNLTDMKFADDSSFCYAS